jgi:putative membrane protein
MPAGFADDDARVAFRDAIRAVEAGSAAEVVVSVRRQSAPWIHPHLIAGIAGAIGADAYMLLAPQPFSTRALLVEPILVGVAVGLASLLVLPLKRWLTPRRLRRRAVATAARAAFRERGIHRTRGATGILVYLSIVERMAEVVADDGVAAAVDPEAWDPHVAAIDAAVPRGPAAVAAAVAGLATLLAAALPRAADDVNELPDELHVHEDDR